MQRDYNIISLNCSPAVRVSHKKTKKNKAITTWSRHNIYGIWLQNNTLTICYNLSSVHFERNLKKQKHCHN